MIRDRLALARVDPARESLEHMQLLIDEIAARSGYRNATTLRHHFRRKLHISPSAYQGRSARTTGN